MEEEKIYLHPGDKVKLKQFESPIMIVVRRDVALFKDGQPMKGLRCRWFTTTGELQEAVWSTKDLILV